MERASERWVSERQTESTRPRRANARDRTERTFIELELEIVFDEGLDVEVDLVEVGLELVHHDRRQLQRRGRHSLEVPGLLPV